MHWEKIGSINWVCVGRFDLTFLKTKGGETERNDVQQSSKALVYV